MSDTATAPTWDLDHLIDLPSAGLDAIPDGDGAAAVDALLDEAQRRAEAFAAEHEGKVALLDGAGLREAMERARRDPASSPGGRSTTRTCASPATRPTPRSARCCRAPPSAPPSSTPACSSSSSSGSRSTTSAPRSCSRPTGLDFCRHHLRLERRYRPHLLSAPEERIASELSVTGAGAWSRLFDELTSAIRVDRRPASRSSRSRSTRRSPSSSTPIARQRRKTAEAVTEALEPALRTRAYVFNTLLQEKSIKDRLRQLPALARDPQPLATRPPTSPCRRWSRRSRPATSCPGAGTGRRRSCSASSGSPTTTGWRSSAPTTPRSAGRRAARSSSTRSAASRRQMREIAERFMTRLDRRAAAAERSAAAPSAPRPCPASTPT